MFNIVQRVSHFIAHHHLLKADGRYIVALSGGADSVALLLIMKELGYHISAAHCNFHLRGEESERDEMFCVNLCKRLNITLHRIHFDTQEYAQLHRVSIEMAARDLRYRYFAQLAKDTEADGICVAHHRDDNAETLLLNLLRGSGVDGLAGIAPKNGNILRPLLCISRTNILEYLNIQEQDYVVDSTNLEDDALRNKIRLHVIPLLQSINPAACENIAHSAEYVRQACNMLRSITLPESKAACNTAREDDTKAPSPSLHTVYINKVEVMQTASPEYVLHQLIGRYGFHGDCINTIIESMQSNNGSVGKNWKSNDYMLVIDRTQLIVTPLKHLEECQQERIFRIPEEGNYNIKNKKIRIRQYAIPTDFKPSRAPQLITLDADKVNFPLTYRRTQNADRFHPFGMKGSKLVSDYLTDRKRNYMEKLEQHVLTDREGEIIWLVGERTSDATKITGQTKNILEIEISEEKR